MRDVAELTPQHPPIPEGVSNLVRQLLDGKTKSREEIAASLGVSTRTVRTYVSSANRCLEGVASIKSQRGKGIRLVIQDEDRFGSMMNAGEVRSLQPLTAQERADYILQDLLMRSDWVTLEQLSKELYVSRATLSGDLAEVERRFSEFGLTVERRSHHGIRVTGPEVARRNCMAAYSVQPYLDDSDSAADEAKELVEEVSDCVSEVLDSNGMRIRYFVWHGLVVHLAIAVMRIRRNCYVPIDEATLEKIEKSHEYGVAQQIAKALEKRFDIDLPEPEVAYIALHLAGKEELPQFPSSGSSTTSLVISDEVAGVVDEILAAVKEAHGYDLSDDLELHMNLARHIVPLAIRIRYQMPLDNPLMEDIRTHYPLALCMAHTAATVLEKHYGGKMSESECGYIALAFELALERQETGRQKKNILVVCATGMGSAQLMKYQYERMFEDCIDKVYACDVSRISEVDFSDIDYVFTTVHIEESLPVPVREVSFFLSDDGVKDIRNLLSEMDVSSSCFSPDLFFPHLAFGTKDEALRFLCDKALGTGDVPESFEELVREREEMGPTSFGNGIAMPHASRAVASKTFACVGILDEPVDWDGQEVSVILLLAAARNGHDELDAFARRVWPFVSSKSSVETLVNAQSFPVLMELLGGGASTAGGT